MNPLDMDDTEEPDNDSHPVGVMSLPVMPGACSLE
jgi:hypothetical protein